MLITLFNDGDTILRIDTYLKHCVECGQYSPYVITYPNRHFGWRLCALHMSDKMRNIIRRYYGL